MFNVPSMIAFLISYLITIPYKEMLYISILYKQITSTENDRLYASQLGQAITLPFPNPLYKRLI